MELVKVGAAAAAKGIVDTDTAAVDGSVVVVGGADGADGEGRGWSWRREKERDMGGAATGVDLGRFGDDGGRTLASSPSSSPSSSSSSSSSYSSFPSPSSSCGMVVLVVAVVVVVVVVVAAGAVLRVGKSAEPEDVVKEGTDPDMPDMEWEAKEEAEEEALLRSSSNSSSASANKSWLEKIGRDVCLWKGCGAPCSTAAAAAASSSSSLLTMAV